MNLVFLNGHLLKRIKRKELDEISERGTMLRPEFSYTNEYVWNSETELEFTEHIDKNQRIDVVSSRADIGHKTFITEAPGYVFNEFNLKEMDYG
jgi:hypothetical protein